MSEKKNPFRMALGELMGESYADAAPVPPVTEGNVAEEPLKEEEQRQEKAAIKLPEESVRPCSVIEEDLVISGSVKSKGNIVMKGCVHGDITCGGKLTVQGTVIGDIRAESIDMQNARVKGETRCGGRLEIDEHSTLLGNVTGGDSTIRGKIRGDVTARGAISVEPTAIIVGDLSFENLELRSGAVVSGRLFSEKVKDIELEFEEIAESIHEDQ